MNILHVTTQKPDSTGSGVYLSQVIGALDRAGHTQAVVCGVAPEDRPVFPAGVQVFPVRYSTPDLPFPVVGMSDEMPYESTRYRDMTPAMVQQLKDAFAMQLTAAAAALQPDLIVCNHLYLVTALVRRLFPQTKVAALCHGSELRQMRQHQLERAYILEGVAGLDAVFALHEENKRAICAEYDLAPERVHVLGTGYDQRVFHLGGSAASPADKRPVDLIFAGKIAYKKGVLSLIPALSQVEAPAGRLDLYGGAGNADELARAQQLAAESPWDVRLQGKVAPAQLADAYRSSKVFVLPSFYEGLPLVVVEALACGCAVVVTDLPGIRPWIEGNLPDAPVFFVEPPVMTDVDNPDPASLPAFEARLARGIELALAAANAASAANGDANDAASADASRADGFGDFGVTALSWDALAQRLLAAVS